MAKDAKPKRAVLLTGGAVPDPLSLRPGDLVLDAGSAFPLPAGVRRIGARELLGWEECEDLTRACLEFATTWHRDLPVLAGAGASAGRLIESDLVIDLGQTLKLLILAHRLAASEGIEEIEADLHHAAIARIAPVLASGARPVRVVPPHGLSARIRRVALHMKSALPRRGASRAPGTAPSSSRPSGPDRIRVWALAMYRNREIIRRLAADPAFDVRTFERSSENQYLPAPEDAAKDDGRRDPAAGGAGIGSAQAVSAARRAASAIFAGIDGAGDAAGEVAVRVIMDVADRIVPAAASAAAGWERVLAADRPAAIVSGITWAGDLRGLALVAARSGIPVVVCQDGALGERGAGGVPVGSGALAWGPRGRAWFARRGFDDARIREIGDPYMDRLMDEVRAAETKDVRTRLGVPGGSRILLAGIQNSSPHHIFTEPGDPIRAARALAEGAARAAGWTLVFKPHPRLTLVDGERRLEDLRRLAAALPNARCAEPGEPIVGLMAAAGAFVSEGDTLSLEMLRAGKPSAVLIHDALPAFYPEFTENGAMPVLHSPGDLAAWLDGGASPGAARAARALLDSHLREEATPAEALRQIAGSRGWTTEQGSP